MRLYKFNGSMEIAGLDQACIRDARTLTDTMEVIAVVDRGLVRRPVPVLEFRDVRSFEGDDDGAAGFLRVNYRKELVVHLPEQRPALASYLIEHGRMTLAVMPFGLSNEEYGDVVGVQVGIDVEDDPRSGPRGRSRA